MPDTTTTLDHLRAEVARFVAERDWEVYHTPKSLSMSIAIEAGELMELFQWHGNEASRAVAEDPARRADLAGELADVLIYALALANVTGIDVSDALLAKLARNQVRFPPGNLPSRHRLASAQSTFPDTGDDR
ncbi:MAG: nucleotide pyrophosphohydrolase [Caldilineales bacterium]